MNIIFHTLGCKVNQYETEAIKEMFLKHGHLSDSSFPADVMIINSCTVTAESDRKTRQLLRRLRRENPACVIVLTGCMVQAFPDASNELADADIVIGNKNPQDIINKVEDYLADKKRIFEYCEHKKGDSYNTPDISDFSERTRAFMKIEDGCDRFCSYCIIPTARGRVRSRSLNDIKSEALRLSSKGYKEIVLVGINLSAYGKGETFNICDAVEAVSQVEGIERIRLGSLEPDHITDEMLNRLNNVDKFCPQFHLSLQSGSDTTLKRMNRHYDSAFYRDLVNRINAIFPNASVTTDVMVGFVGETDEEFEESVKFAQEIGFARMHVFAYSKRFGTAAASLKGHLTNALKSQRAKIMGATAKSLEQNFLEGQVNGIYPVLFETGENGYYEGYTPNYSKVIVKSEDNLKGQIMNVKIIEAHNDYCVGKLI